MRAIAHGWKPPKGSDVAKIPVSVAKEFAAADDRKKKRGASLYDHPRKQD